jgi:hypothetical protein
MARRDIGMRQLFGQVVRCSVSLYLADDGGHRCCFWGFWIAAAVLHVVVMWLLFGLALPGLALGTLYVIPLAILETYGVFLVYLKIAATVRDYGRTVAKRPRARLERLEQSPGSAPGSNQKSEITSLPPLP